jgi:hypothetical protein
MNVATQEPALHRPPSASVHTVPSPFTLGAPQIPVPVSHVPGVWQAGAVQTTGLPPVQIPDWQVSVWVHALLSSQPSPLFFAGLEQTPPLHVPARWH